VVEAIVENERAHTIEEIGDRRWLEGGDYMPTETLYIGLLISFQHQF
jgi:hypothetical protein